MTWFLVAYLAGLLYLAVNREKIQHRGWFRAAWMWFGWALIVRFGFALIRAGNIEPSDDLLRTNVIDEGVGWLLLGISVLCLLAAFVPGESAEEADPDER